MEPEPDKKQRTPFGDLLEEIMTAEGWSRTRLAEKMGRDPAELTKWCDEGRAPLPSTADEIGKRPDVAKYAARLSATARAATLTRIERAPKKAARMRALQARIATLEAENAGLRAEVANLRERVAAGDPAIVREFADAVEGIGESDARRLAGGVLELLSREAASRRPRPPPADPSRTPDGTDAARGGPHG